MLHAYWNASKGDARSALRDVDAMFAIARHESKNPWMLNELVATALEGMAGGSLRNVFDLTQPTAKVWRRSASMLPRPIKSSCRRPFARKPLRAGLYYHFAGLKMMNMR